MQFAMGGGGGGGSIAGGSEGGFSQHIETAPLLAFILPHGHQSILTAQRGGLFDAQMPGLFGGNLFEPRAKGLFADLKQRLSGPMTNGAPEIGPMSYGEPMVSNASFADLGGIAPSIPRGDMGGGHSIEI
jgi:hypothetical protein